MPSGISLPEAEYLAQSDPLLYEVIQKMLSAVSAAASSIQRGSDSPEGSLAAVGGTLYVQLSKSAASLWMKTAGGSGKTGWAQLATSSPLKAVQGVASIGQSVQQISPAGTPASMLLQGHTTLDHINDSPTYSRLRSVTKAHQATGGSITPGTINRVGIASFSGASLGLGNSMATIATVTPSSPLNNGDVVLAGLNVTASSGFTDNRFLNFALGGLVYSGFYINYLWGNGGLAFVFQWPGTGSTSSLLLEAGTSQTTGPVTITGTVIVTNQQDL